MLGRVAPHLDFKGGSHACVEFVWIATTQRGVISSTSKIAMEEPMTMEFKKITTKKERSKKLVETLLYKDLMERKIRTLTSFLVDNQLDGKNYTTWVLQMEALLESYDLTFMVL